MRPQRVRAGQRLTRRLPLLLVAAGLLTACSADEPQPSAELPPATSSAAESTPELPPLGPADFPVPDEARTQDEAGAEAFLRYYIDLINEQLEVPDGEALRLLSPGCTECERIANRLDAAAASSETFRGGRIALTGEAGWSVTESEAKASFYVRIEPGAQLRADGSTVEGTRSDLQERLPSAALLTWSDTRRSWLTSAMSFG